MYCSSCSSYVGCLRPRQEARCRHWRREAGGADVLGAEPDVGPEPGGVAGHGPDQELDAAARAQADLRAQVAAWQTLLDGQELSPPEQAQAQTPGLRREERRRRRKGQQKERSFYQQHCDAQCSGALIHHQQQQQRAQADH